MALTSPDNIWTPDSSDNYALTTDLAATADSIQDALTALRGNNAPTVRVANVAERNAALADHGTPSTSNPLIVFRADAGDGREIEYTTDGSLWRTVPAEPDSGWVTQISAEGSDVFTATGGATVTLARANRVGDTASLHIRVSGITLSSGSQNTIVGNIKEPFRPTDFAGWVGPTASIAVMGLTSAGGDVSVRWASGSFSSTGLYIAGSWPCAPL